MDKRSVLVDALAYLRSIHEEIALIQEELKGRNNVHTSLQTSDPCAGRHRSSCGVAPGSIPKAKGHEIVQVICDIREVYTQYSFSFLYHNILI